jgi:hypothetical protein
MMGSRSSRAGASRLAWVPIVLQDILETAHSINCAAGDSASKVARKLAHAWHTGWHLMEPRGATFLTRADRQLGRLSRWPETLACLGVLAATQHQHFVASGDPRPVSSGSRARSRTFHNALRLQPGERSPTGVRRDARRQSLAPRRRHAAHNAIGPRRAHLCPGHPSPSHAMTIDERRRRASSWGRPRPAVRES